MLQRDYFMRQVQQLAQALQQVIMQKEEERIAEARRTIREAIEALEQGKERDLRERSLKETLQFCRRDGAFRPELAAAVADLLKEEGDLLTWQGQAHEAEKSRTRALLLYRRAMQEKDAALPLNVAAKLSGLEAELSAARIEEIEAVLKGRREN